MFRYVEPSADNEYSFTIIGYDTIKLREHILNMLKPVIAHETFRHTFRLPYYPQVDTVMGQIKAMIAVPLVVDSYRETDEEEGIDYIFYKVENTKP